MKWISLNKAQGLTAYPPWSHLADKMNHMCKHKCQELKGNNTVFNQINGQTRVYSQKLQKVNTKKGYSLKAPQYYER